MSDTNAEYLARRAELEAEASCPIQWLGGEDYFRVSDLADALEALWISQASEHQVDLESEWCDAETADPAATLDDIRTDLTNLRTWIDRAGAKYVEATRRFWSLRVASVLEYPRHFPPARLTLEEIRERTRGDAPSLFYPGVTVSALKEVLWLGLSTIARNAEWERWRPLWWEILDNESSRFAMRCTVPIGFTGGADTPWLCFEMNASAAVSHAYPISNQEAAQLMGDLHIEFDDLGGVEQRLGTVGLQSDLPFGRRRP